ncbi:MAG: glycosyltransferase family 2 protein [Lachnospiraceae bacterium]|jgi:glycosyltransferase involved in cell wall biosynthesis|nr:glycosyltransferase family 2 protein [Lachnospiraceae bacterium]MEE3461038.1 glycosyltransferase family 2 protein [Lachnospiraceae bacterium]
MSVRNMINEALNIIRVEGFRSLLKKIRYKLTFYKNWMQDNEKDILKTEKLKFNPKFSVVVPVYNVTSRILSECIDSVLAQTYKNFELCIADDSSTMPEVILTLKKYESDPRVKIVYRKENGNISKAGNSAIELADGDFICFLDCDDVLSPNALYENALALNDDPDLDFIYSDEDKLTADSKKRKNPLFKPDWSPDLFMTSMYTCHFAVFRKAVGDKVGWLKSQYDGAQDYDFTLRFTEKTDHIYHIRKILYHWRMSENSTADNPMAKKYIYERTEKMKEEALQRRNIEGKVVYIPDCYLYKICYAPVGNPLVSIIIPSKENFDVFKRCVDSIVEKTDYRNFEIILVDNGSSKETEERYRNYLDGLKQKGIFSRYIYEKADFNFSRMCNQGAFKAKGSLLLFLNDDTEVVNGSWLELMAGHAMQKRTGAVGAKLLYPDSSLIQHIGIAELKDGPVHIYCGSDDKRILMYDRNRIDYDCTAVTAACLMVSAEKYRAVQGFDESFPVAYNDVKLCFDLMKNGWYNVCRMDAVLYHHESLSRGLDEEDARKREKRIAALKRLYDLYPEYEGHDPFYNSNLLQ